MNQRLLVLRPEPGLSATLAEARRTGIDATGIAIARVEPVAWDLPDPTSFDALLIGSANAVRHGGEAIAQLRGRLAHVVGKATAKAAREAGLTVGEVGSGGLQALLDDMSAAPARLLRLAGEVRLPLLAPPGTALVERVVYRLAYTEFADDLRVLLRDGGTVLLYSGEAAAHFARACDRLQIDRSRVCIAALGPRIAAAAGSGWRKVGSATHADDAALLALARDMCH